MNEFKPEFILNTERRYIGKKLENVLIEGARMLEIVVHEIRGHCPVYKKGDMIVIADPEIDLEKTDALCTHALSTLLHYALILEHDWCPVKLGLTTAEDEEHAYMQCVDPGKPYTEGGTVIFKCKVIKTRAKTSKGQQDQSNSPVLSEY